MKQIKVNKSKIKKFKFLKTLTGIQGLDEITGGGIPKHRPTLLLGNSGSGKTIMAMEFLVNGIGMFDEPAVFMAFEEKKDELVMNLKSLGFSLEEYIANNKIYIELVLLDKNEIR